VSEKPTSSRFNYQQSTHPDKRNKDNTTMKVCSAQLFWKTLILLFSPEPRCFLIDFRGHMEGSDFVYRKPKLFHAQTQEEISDFNELKHSNHYFLEFETQSHDDSINTSIASIAFTSQIYSHDIKSMTTKK